MAIVREKHGWMDPWSATAATPSGKGQGVGPPPGS
jgi:hypothetical protein